MGIPYRWDLILNSINIPSQYYTCWWPGDIRSQGISRDDIDVVRMEYFVAPCLNCWKICLDLILKCSRNHGKYTTLTLLFENIHLYLHITQLSLILAHNSMSCSLTSLSWDFHDGGDQIDVSTKSYIVLIIITIIQGQGLFCVCTQPMRGDVTM